tara:strand:- start:4852 stop:6219 length:1368 start_codon:yes stop_codon:yes gene_type:complete
MKTQPKTLKEELTTIIKPTNKKTCSTSPPNKGFNPYKTFYDSSNGKYITDVGTHYRPYGSKTVIRKGIKRYCSSNDIRDNIDDLIESVELDRAIDWQGSIAGYTRGLKKLYGKSFLITDEPMMIQPEQGKLPLIESVIKQAFPEHDERIVFLSWLRDAVRAIRSSHHHPAPMLVMAGERNAGKSLIASIVQKSLGGRASNPMKTWSGKTIWNDDLLRAELLLIDDSEASTDIRARKALGANFKESIYGGNIKIQTRNRTAMDMRPVWRVMICCNETPENLSVIPPLEEGIEDKIILLKVKKIKTPMPAQTTAEKAKFFNGLIAELPAFMAYLETLETPAHLQDDRDGVTAWKDPYLLQAIKDISPEHRLEELIYLCMKKGFMDIEQGESCFMSSAEIQDKLLNRDSPTYEQTKGLLSYHGSCGTYLGRLHKQASALISDRRVYQGTTQYKIERRE